MSIESHMLLLLGAREMTSPGSQEGNHQKSSVVQLELGQDGHAGCTHSGVSQPVAHPRPLENIDIYIMIRNSSKN